MITKIFQLFRKNPNFKFLIAVQQYLGINLNAGIAKEQKTIPKIAVEIIPDTVYFGLMYALIADINSKNKVDAEMVIVRSVNACFGFSFLSEIRRVALLNWIVMRQWISSFRFLTIQVAFRSSSWNSPFKDAWALLTSYQIWLSWKRRDGATPLDALVVDGIVCGDLIIDSYIRFKPSPSFNVQDIFVWRLLWQACRDINRARKYFRKNRPAVYLTTYSSYIEHGIPVRVALDEKIPVFSFGNFFKFGLQLTADHFRHTPDCSGYKQDFEKLDPMVRETYLKEAEDILEFRMLGGLDNATRYMRNSAYARAELNSHENLSELKGAVVVFLHDFYDSPHIWDGFIFTDFWEWVVSTINILEKEKIKFFIKPHPNQISLADKAIAQLRAINPKLNWLDSSIDNKTLAKAGISCGITVYGSIAHELAYLGVPTIGAASAPHESFFFCNTAKDLDEYIQLLKKCHLPRLPSEDMRQEALRFFTIHNSLHDPISREVSKAFVEYWVLASKARSEDESKRAVDALDCLRNSDGYKALIAKLSFLIN